MQVLLILITFKTAEDIKILNNHSKPYHFEKPLPVDVSLHYSVGWVVVAAVALHKSNPGINHNFPPVGTHADDMISVDFFGYTADNNTDDSLVGTYMEPVGHNTDAAFASAVVDDNKVFAEYV